MKISFYNGVSGLIAYQESMNRISHNISNSGTVGFKPSRSEFDDLLYTRMAVNSEEEPLTGHGVKIGDNQLIFRQGAVIQTGMPLDFALMGDGLFAVEKPDGSIQYTRSGAFDLSPMSETEGALVTSDGSFVLDARGERIILQKEAGKGLFETEGLSTRIGVYDFPNPFGLEPAAGSCFTATETSGEAVAVANGGTNQFNRNYQVINGSLEQSATDLSEEMANVIVTQKAFQFSAKMVQTADELEQVINNLRQ